ncbi:hypothetical protein FRX31_023688, partial [Thalictrum thalictroides]
MKYGEKGTTLFKQQVRPYQQVIQCIIQEFKLRFSGIQLKLINNPSNKAAAARIPAIVHYKDSRVKTCQWEAPAENHLVLNIDGRLCNEGGACASL